MSGPVGENLWRPNRWATLSNLAWLLIAWTATVVILTLMAVR